MMPGIISNINNERENQLLERNQKRRLLHQMGYVFEPMLYRYDNVLQIGMSISINDIELLSLNRLKEMIIHTKRSQIQQLIRKLDDDIRKIENF